MKICWALVIGEPGFLLGPRRVDLTQQMSGEDVVTEPGGFRFKCLKFCCRQAAEFELAEEVALPECHLLSLQSGGKCRWGFDDNAFVSAIFHADAGLFAQAP